MSTVSSIKVPRGLNSKFLTDLKVGGCLYPLLEAVIADDTLNLDIRNDYINIYYRGGSLFLVKQDLRCQIGYRFDFDNNYCLDKLKNVRFIEPVCTTINDYVDSIPQYKRCMDYFFSSVSDNREKEVQQLIAHENNMGRIANDTDYYIADIEYATAANQCRFDMIGVKWRSTSNDRKKTDNLPLALIEVKYGDKALKGTSGIVGHLNDISEFINDPTKFSNFCDEMEIVMNQKIELGLFDKLSERKTKSPSYKIGISHDPKQVELIFVFVNHKPSATALITELCNAMKVHQALKCQFSVKIATASYMGYGLYIDNMVDLGDFMVPLSFCKAVGLGEKHE